MVASYSNYEICIDNGYDKLIHTFLFDKLGISILHDLHQQCWSLLQANNTEQMTKKKVRDKVTNVICKLGEVKPYFNDIAIEEVLRATEMNLTKRRMGM